jgi:hypothetical protein
VVLEDLHRRSQFSSFDHNEDEPYEAVSLVSRCATLQPFKTNQRLENRRLAT